MNTPNPLVPQGSFPQRGKSIYFKVLMIVAIHTVLIGGILMVGCKDANKDHATTTPPDETATAANTSSNSGPMSADLPAPTPATPAPITPTAQPVANNMTPAIPVAAPVAAPAITPVAAAVSPVAAAPISGEAREYAIVSGDLLSTIAKKNGVTLKALEEANPGLDPKKLRIGNKIQIPAAVATTSSTSSGATSSGAMADANAPASGDSTSYTVKSGDALIKIAKSHGTTVKLIMALNDMKTTSIKVNQKLKLPVMKVASADIPAPTTMAPTPATPAPINAPAAPTALKAVAN